MKIAIIGKMGSGKTTLANYIKNTYDYTILSFAAPVKKYATEIFNIQTKDRAILQDFAQKIKEIDPNVWVNYLIRQITTDNIIVDDLRFPNEYNALKQLGFIFIKLEIEPEFQKERLKQTYKSSYKQHIERISNISESYISDLKEDYTFKITSNNQQDIYIFIDKILQRIKE